MQSVQLVIFDCDGVLIDSETIANQVCVEHVSRLGLHMTMQEFAAEYSGSPVRDIWRRVEERIGATISDAFRKQVDDEVHRRFESDLKEMEGVFDVLNQILVPKCVASSTGLVKLKKNLTQVGLHESFDPGIFSASQVARGKPSPDVFMFAASQMGADPGHCLVIEDSVAGVKAARRAGMRVIGFSGGGHTLGDHDRKLLDVGAEHVVSSMKALNSSLSDMQLATRL